MITIVNTQMKSLTCLVFLFILGSCKSSVAQSEIQPIRAAYQEIGAQIKECKNSIDPCGLYLATWELNKDGEPWRAVGNHNQTFEFWYIEREDEPMTYQPLKVMATRVVSAYKIYEEWLFNEKGDLLFYYLKDESDENQPEKRYYFNNGELIQTIPNGLESSTSVDDIFQYQIEISNIFQKLIKL